MSQTEKEARVAARRRVEHASPLLLSELRRLIDVIEEMGDTQVITTEHADELLRDARAAVAYATNTL